MLENIHDSGLLNINFLFERRIIEVLVEEEADGRRWNLIFNNVSDVNIGDLNSLSDFDLIEINSMTIKRKNELFSVKIILLLGFGKPSWEISFNYNELIPTLLEDKK